MEALELTTPTNSKIGKSFKVKVATLTQENEPENLTVGKKFSLVDYLRNSKEYVLGHAAFTK